MGPVTKSHSISLNRVQVLVSDYSIHSLFQEKLTSLKCSRVLHLADKQCRKSDTCRLHVLFQEFQETKMRFPLITYEPFSNLITYEPFSNVEARAPSIPLLNFPFKFGHVVTQKY